MSNILKIPRQYLFLSTMGILFTLIPLAQFSSLDFAPSLIAGCILSIMNAFLGYMVIERSFRLNDRQFIIVSLGSFVIRFFAMIAAVTAILIIARVNVIAFIFSLLVFYVFFMAIEIAHIHRKISLLKTVPLSVKN